MTAHNQSYRGVLSNNFNLGWKQKDLSRFWKAFLSHNWSWIRLLSPYMKFPGCPTSYFKTLGNLNILGKSQKCFQLKRSSKPATRNENFDSWTRQQYKFVSKTCHRNTYFWFIPRIWNAKIVYIEKSVLLSYVAFIFLVFFLLGRAAFCGCF